MASSNGCLDRSAREPTWDALAEVLRETSPHIVHYVGHAGIDRGEGNLILHDNSNVSHWISGPQLSLALPLTVRMLNLSTCFTAPNYQILGLPRLAHTSATYRLPTTVTNRYPVEEEGHSVHAFWETFYSSLAEHHGNANEAFHDAQRAVADVSGAEADWGSFSLVIRDQSGEVMRIEEAGTISTEKWEEESQAQFASRFANDMAERLFSLGPKAPESIQKEFEQEVETASELARNLYRKG